MALLLTHNIINYFEEEGTWEQGGSLLPVITANDELPQMILSLVSWTAQTRPGVQYFPHAAEPLFGKIALISAVQQISVATYVNFTSYTTDTLMQMLFAEY